MTQLSPLRPIYEAGEPVHFATDHQRHAALTLRNRHGDNPVRVRLDDRGGATVRGLGPGYYDATLTSNNATIATSAVVVTEGPPPAQSDFGICTSYGRWMKWQHTDAINRMGLSVRNSLRWADPETHAKTIRQTAKAPGFLLTLGLGPKEGVTPRGTWSAIDFSEHVRKVLRSAPHASTVEVWNEPDGKRYRPGVADSEWVSWYEALCRVVIPVIRQERPDVKIAIGALSDWRLAEKLIERGLHKLADQCSVHLYPPTENGIDIEGLRALNKRLGDCELIVTEYGKKTDDGIEKAGQLIKSYCRLRAAGIRKIYYYGAYDKPNPSHSILTVEGHATPAAAAAAMVVRELAGREWIASWTNSESIEEHVFDAGNVAVRWRKSRVEGGQIQHRDAEVRSGPVTAFDGRPIQHDGTITLAQGLPVFARLG